VSARTAARSPRCFFFVFDIIVAVGQGRLPCLRQASANTTVYAITII
jgi:hypothetical protein